MRLTIGCDWKIVATSEVEPVVSRHHALAVLLLVDLAVTFADVDPVIVIAGE